MIGVSCIFEFGFFHSFLHWESVDTPYCSLIMLNMFLFVDSVVFILFSEFITS